MSSRDNGWSALLETEDRTVGVDDHPLRRILRLPAFPQDLLCLRPGCRRSFELAGSNGLFHQGVDEALFLVFLAWEFPEKPIERCGRCLVDEMERFLEFFRGREEENLTTDPEFAVLCAADGAYHVPERDGIEREFLSPEVVPVDIRLLVAFPDQPAYFLRFFILLVHPGGKVIILHDRAATMC